MSQAEESGNLDVAAGAGIAYRVVDAFGKEFGQGSGTSHFQLPQGVYAVQWLSGGEQSETLVRVLRGKNVQARNVPADAPEGQKLTQRIARASRVVKELRPSEQNHASAITVVLTSKDKSNAREILKNLRLIDVRDVGMPSFEGKLPEIALRGGELVRCYQVPPGRFRLAFVAHTGETFEQSVPALKGRQTIVFLEAVRSQVLVSKGSGFAKVHRYGVDAARTVLITLNGNENDKRVRERFRLTDLLLRDLAGDGAALTDDFCSILEKRSVDPLLKLAAATVVLARLEAGKSPALVRSKSDEQDDFGMRHKWLRRAASWLPRSRLGAFPTDATIVWWQMKKLGWDGMPSTLPKAITAPPMFACAWRWAMARSAVYPRAIARNAALRAAEGGSSVEPWLCWKAAAAKGQPTLPANGGDRESGTFAVDLAEKVKATFGVGSRIGFRADPFVFLGPEDGALALALQQDPKESLLGRLPVSLAESVASTLAIPGRSLFQRLTNLDNALDELQVAAAVQTQSTRALKRSYEADELFNEVPKGAAKRKEVAYNKVELAPGARRARPSKAPALSRRIIVPDDPQKRRFGGLSERFGYSLTATFTSTRSKDWTRIVLTVTGPADDDEPALFFLHDSFSPDMEEVGFRKGRASLQVTAWGGFTAGLWLPYRGIELELDLALLPYAPEAIRTR